MKKHRSPLSFAAELGMYVIMLVQLLYVFTGNTAHELLGMAFFALLAIHIYIKRKWFALVLRRGKGTGAARRFADLMILLLMPVLLLLALSSMGVSRLLFPGVHFLGSPAFHSTLASAALALAVVHGGMHMYFRAKKKTAMVILIAASAAACFGMGLGLVPWMNRHLRVVDIVYSDSVNGERLQAAGELPLVVYFTRVGNTDFDDNISAVSGASLLLADGRLMGNTLLLADMLCDISGARAVPVTLTGEHYPSSYSDTVTVAGRELKAGLRPGIEDIDISDCSSIILVYPIWWGTVPMPVAGFLESGDFSGKTVYLIATQGSSGFASSAGAVRELIPGAEVIEGLSIYCDDIPKARPMLSDWLLASGICS